jgi:peptidoglycan/LPS O-acetylase OafA/YrhL
MLNDRDAVKFHRLTKSITYNKQACIVFSTAPTDRFGVMGFYVVWPFFLIMIIIVLLAGTPLLKSADAPPSMIPARVQTIDGLRGFLALGVFFHHAAIYHQYLLTDRWNGPPSRFYANIGPVGVAMFFMITAYLFYTRLLKVRGRTDFLKLYIGRAFRIVPLYLLLAFFVLLSAGVLTAWRLQETPLALIQDVATWLAGGVVVGGSVNGQDTAGISARVTWSLKFEWAFYASLLVTSLFARHVILGALLPVIGMLVFVPLLILYPASLNLACVLTFLVGMAVASVRHGFFVAPIKAPQWAMSIVVVGCLALVLFVFDAVYSALSILVLGVAFGLVVSGTTVFGLLVTRSAKRLGDISYGIYLLQGPILFLSFSSSFVRPFVIASPWSHWMTVMLAGISLVIVATMTHGLIEQPGIAVGQWVCARLTWTRPERRGAPI